jgi:hypothetical protein
MDQQGGLLRSRLRDGDEVLFRALEQSWSIATNEWLAALGADTGSTNAYPHLRNVENYLNHIIKQYERAERGPIQKLSPAENYLLLSSVLFHDLGYCLQDPHNVGHAALSWKYILEKFSHLGIPSYELARSIASMCIYHDPPDKDGWQELVRPGQVLLDTKLSTSVIDPYGEIREPFLAALLKLADHMDGTYSRVLPLYLRSRDELGPVGLFRRAIRGIYADPEAHMIKTVLVPIISRGTKRDEKRGQADQYYRFSVNRRGDWRRVLKTNETVPSRKVLEGRTSDFRRLKPERKLGELEKIIRRIMKQGLWKQLFRKERKLLSCLFSETPLLHYLLMSDLLRLRLEIPPKKKKKGNEARNSYPMPSCAPQAIVFGNMRDNCQTVAEVREILSAAGLTLTAWLIEHEEQLYNQRGQETYEPIFTKDYLKDIAEGLWHLSSRVFGLTDVAYEDLGSYYYNAILAQDFQAAGRCLLSEPIILKGATEWTPNKLRNWNRC